MFLTFTFVLGLALLGNTTVIVVAGLVIAVILALGALYLFRSNSKKKRVNADAQGANGAVDWQRQQGQLQQGGGSWNQQAQGMGGMGASNDAPWQQQGAPSAWNQPAMGMDNTWQAAQPQQAAPGAWNQPGMTNDNPWASPAQQPSWNAPNAAQQPVSWEAQRAAPQADAWAAQNPAPQANTWNAPSPAQPQANNWNAPAQPQAGGWNQSGTQLPGMGNQQPWDASATANAQDAAWAQPQAIPPAASPWNAQGNSPAPLSQQAQTAYGGPSGPAWGQPAPSSEPWAQQSAPPAPAQPAAWPQSFQPPSAPPSTPPSTGNVAPSWQGQSPNQGYGQSQGQQGQQGYGLPGPGMYPQDDSDKTMLRSNPMPPQAGAGRLGIVRIEEGKEPGRVYEVRKDSLSIGRSRESDIFLEDLAVSRLHASIVSLGSGNYALRDEGSANGTKVNGQTVNKYQPYPLQEGDKIQLGQTVLVFAKR